MFKNFKIIHHIWKLLILSFIFTTGCATIKPTIFPDTQAVAPRIFSHASFERVLQRFVNDDGKVDY
ncbi:MAG: hypothetical protein ACYSR9_04350, partial [Planctomycetota bacterium]